VTCACLFLTWWAPALPSGLSAEEVQCRHYYSPPAKFAFQSTVLFCGLLSHFLVLVPFPRFDTAGCRHFCLCLGERCCIRPCSGSSASVKIDLVCQSNNCLIAGYVQYNRYVRHSVASAITAGYGRLTCLSVDLTKARHRWKAKHSFCDDGWAREETRRLGRRQTSDTCQKYFLLSVSCTTDNPWKLDLRNYLGSPSELRSLSRNVTIMQHNSTCNPTSPLSSLDDMIHVILEKSPPFYVY
jgi:hypothetical protein